MFLYTHHEITELSYDKQVIFFWLKKRHFEEFCIGCIQVLTHQKKKIHIFGKPTELLGIIGFTRTRLKNRPSFLFILKQ